MSGAKVPSIRARVANALLLWAVVWGAGVSLAVGYAAQGEVEELLDQSLQATEGVLASALRVAYRDAGPESMAVPLPASTEGDFAWQLVSASGAVLQRSANAPAKAFNAVATAGFSSLADWRVFGAATGRDGHMLYVAHTLRERVEVQTGVVLSAAFSALSIGLLGHLWLRARVRDELRPLLRLSDKLERHDPLDRAHVLGPAERAELVPVHTAIDQLGQRLARRVAHERAFASHAAHALRTPLAGMEAQLAVALRESTPVVQQRLQQVREASGRLQRVVQALLDLFRVGSDVQRSAIDLKALLAHLPVSGLEVSVQADGGLLADPDLLAAALSNLLDNAKRYGARHVRVSEPAPGTVRVHDDGPGTTPEHLQALREALSTQDYDGHTGLGLMLSDLVARSHGGALSLPAVAQGFAVDLALGDGRADAG
jgi:signal transduction histidine kinase